MNPDVTSDVLTDPALASVRNLTELSEIQEAFLQAQKEEVCIKWIAIFIRSNSIYIIVFVSLRINPTNSLCCLLFVFSNCYTFHCIECPNAGLSNFCVWFSIWSSLIVITNQGRDSETGWLRSCFILLCTYFK